jgi:hypothetical protein
LILIEVCTEKRYNKAMPHGKTSCLDKRSRILRIELDRLYAQRSAVDAAIQELELRQVTVSSSGESPLQKQTADIIEERGFLSL